MEEHDDRDCNTTLRLGLNQNGNGPKREISSRVFLDMTIPCQFTNLEIIQSSSSLTGFTENETRRSKGEEEIDFFKDCSRKKLRLTKDQTTLLEDSYKLHSTLNTAQKQILAGKLSLKPRQVEVWFQNRRARSKLKQTEVECQLLKKNCERLSEENWRLKKELVELRSKMKIQKRCSLHNPKVVKPERCPSCEKD